MDLADPMVISSESVPAFLTDVSSCFDCGYPDPYDNEHNAAGYENLHVFRNEIGQTGKTQCGAKAEDSDQSGGKYGNNDQKKAAVAAPTAALLALCVKGELPDVLGAAQRTSLRYGAA